MFPFSSPSENHPNLHSSQTWRLNLNILYKKDEEQECARETLTIMRMCVFKGRLMGYVLVNNYLYGC